MKRFRIRKRPGKPPALAQVLNAEPAKNPDLVISTHRTLAGAQLAAAWKVCWWVCHGIEIRYLGDSWVTRTNARALLKGDFRAEYGPLAKNPFDEPFPAGRNYIVIGHARGAK